MPGIMHGSKEYEVVVRQDRIADVEHQDGQIAALHFERGPRFPRMRLFSHVAAEADDFLAGARSSLPRHAPSMVAVSHSHAGKETMRMQGIVHGAR